MYGISRVAVKVDGSTYAGKTITSATWKLMKVGTLTGTCYCKIHDSSDNHVATATTTYNNSTLSSSAYEELTFYFSSPVTLADGHRIFVEYATDDGSGNYVKLGDKHTGSNIVPAGWRYNIYDTANGWNTGQGADYSQKLAPWAKIDQFGCKNNFSATPPLDDLTGVRTNAIFEQTDDVPAYYWYQTLDGVTAWFPTFQDGFITSTNWTSTNALFAVDTSEKAIIADNTQTSTDLQCGADVGLLSDTKWVIDFDMKVTALTSSGSLWTHIGMFSGNTTVNDDPNQDWLGLLLHAQDNQGVNTNAVLLASADNQPLDGAQILTFGEDSLEGSPQFYFRMTRLDADNLKLENYSSSARTGTPSTTVTMTLTGDPQNLKYFKVTNRRVGSGGELDIKIENLKIYDGVTSV